MEIQWMLVIYSLFMGLSVGPFALLALTDTCGGRPTLCKWASVTGLVCIVLAGIAAFAHLGNPAAAVYVFNNFASPITQETVVVLITGVMAVLLAASTLFNWFTGARRLLAWIGLALAVVSVIFIAAIYLLPARPAWNTWLLPITLLASSLINGLLLALALMALAPKEAGESDRQGMMEGFHRWALPMLGVYAVLVVAFFLIAANQAGGIIRLLAGDLAVLFWLGLVLIGLVAPATLLWVSRQKVSSGMVMAFLLVVIGGLVVRVMLFPLGVRVPISSLW